LQVFEVSIAQSCDSIINPEAPLALRLSGQLLLGVVRIYQRKLTFLETDAKNAIDGLQRKEGGQNVDLPDGGTAPEMAITMPDADTGLFAGTELFPSFAIAETPNGGAGAGAFEGGLAARLAPGTESLTFADDISDVLGSSRWTATEERFDLVGGEDIDRRFSAELERLRSAAAVEAPRGTNSDLFFDGPMDDSYGGAIGEIMEPPAEDLFVMPPLDTAGPTPGSIGGALPGGSVQFTPPSLGGLTDGLPDFGGGLTGPSTAADGRHGESPVERSGRNKQRKKKRVQVDVGPGGLAATQMHPDEMRALMDDRAPLLKRRGLPRDSSTTAAAGGGGGTGAEAPPRVFDVRAQSEAAKDSFMYRPACTNRLDPELLAVFNRALGVSENGKVPSAAATRRGNAATAATAGGAQFVISPELGNPGGADVPQPSYSGGASPAPSWGGFDDGGPAMSDGFEPDYIENSQDDGTGPMTAMNAGRTAGGVAAPLDFMTRTGGGDSLRVSLGGFGDGENDDGTIPGGGSAGGEGGAGAGGLASDGFTARTKVVLEHLAYRFVGPTSGTKRRHPGSAVKSTPLIDSLPLDGFVGGRNRLEACRWFFEALVLRNKSYVDLKQNEPYGEISILPLDKMMEAQYLNAEEPGFARSNGATRQRREETPVSEAA
jgi:cohesin complex subunit SCC1